MEIVSASDHTRSNVNRHSAVLSRLARVSPIHFVETEPKGSAQIILGETSYCLPLEGIVDISAEVDRLSKELKKLDGEIRRLEGKLGNEKFVANAPEEVVAEEREKLTGYVTQREKTERALKRIAG